jgi:hypothetical protein
MVALLAGLNFQNKNFNMTTLMVALFVRLNFKKKKLQHDHLNRCLVCPA